MVNRVYGPVDHFQPWSTVDRGHRARPELAGAPTARRYKDQSSPQWRREGESDGVELTEAKIGRRGGEEWNTALCLVLGGTGHG
jgi:hypothetical protein